MEKLNTFKYKKITQVVNFFASKNSGKKIDYLKVIKLIWAADRYHFRKYGRLVTYDKYYAMQHGPVGSCTLDISKQPDSLKEYHPEEFAYSSKYLKKVGEHKIKSKKKPELDFFSKTDLEALNFAVDNFNEIDTFGLRDLTHFYPEWTRHKKDIESGKTKRSEIHLSDFLREPSSQKVQEDKFKLDRKILALSKKMLREKAHS
ncbi:MAG: Panacea domain-containing protein [bacterium]